MNAWSKAFTLFFLIFCGAVVGECWQEAAAQVTGTETVPQTQDAGWCWVETDIVVAGENHTVQSLVLGRGAAAFRLHDHLLNQWPHSGVSYRGIVPPNNDPPATYLEGVLEDPIPNADGTHDQWVVRTPRQKILNRASGRFEYEPPYNWALRHELAYKHAKDYLNHPARISGMI